MRLVVGRGARLIAIGIVFGAAGGVRVMLEGSDLAGVKAAAAGMKVRFGSRFAVTGRRLGADRQVLRISAGLLVTADIANTSGYHLAHL